MKEGWELKKLGEVCEIYSGGTPDSKKTEYWNGNIPFVTLVDTKSRCVYSTIRTITDEGLKKSSAVLLPIDTVLLSSRATIGEVAIAKVPLVTNQGYKNFVCNTEVILPEYLYYGLLSLKEYLISMCKGAVYAEISKQKVSEVKVPVPPLPEQQRIVEILDTAFEKIDAIKQNAERNFINTKELFQSVLKYELTPKLDFLNLKISDVCSEIFAGGDAPSNYSELKTEKNNIPIFANAVKDRGLYGYTDYARVTVPSITIAARGSGTGHVELRRTPFLPIVRLIVLIPNTDIITLEYLKYCISNLQIMRSGSAIPQLTVPMIKGYMLQIPPLSEQQQIVSKLDALSSKCKELENNYLQTINDCDELKKAILAKAFNGEL